MKIQILTKKVELLNRIKEILPNSAIIFDFKMADKSSIIICDAIEALNLLVISSDFKILVLEDYPTYEQAIFLLSKGIKGYGNSYIHYKILLDILQTIESGKIWLSNELVQEMIKNITSSNKKRNSLLEKLTEREFEVSLLISEGRSNQEIALSLNISERTVKNHISHIFEKLNIDDRLSLALLLK